MRGGTRVTILYNSLMVSTGSGHPHDGHLGSGGLRRHTHRHTPYTPDPCIRTHKSDNEAIGKCLCHPPARNPRGWSTRGAPPAPSALGGPGPSSGAGPRGRALHRQGALPPYPHHEVPLTPHHHHHQAAPGRLLGDGLSDPSWHDRQSITPSVVPPAAPPLRAS